MHSANGWFQFVNSDQENDDTASQHPVEPAEQDTELLDAYSRAVVGVVEKVSPAVVGVVRSGDGERGGTGSGFVIAPDGYAVTNSHVVGGRSQVQATTIDGDRVDADVVGDDPSTDLALLRLAASDLPFAEIGDSAALRVGQLVIAMGNPLGFQSTVSTGVVSAVGRAMRSGEGRLIESVVQHTAPLNPGNSGGPLVDSHGHVVGVNTAIIAFAQGLGFAVPSSTAKWVVSEIVVHGRVRRRQLGITANVTQLPRRVVRELDLLADLGIEVVGLAPGGPAADAGILPGDLIVMLNGRIVTNVDDIHRLLSTLPLQDRLMLTIVRGGHKYEVPIAAELQD